MIKRIPGEPATERQTVIPKKRPVYTFEGQPSTDALRQMAVRCMRDQLDIMWSSPKDLTFSITPGRLSPNAKEKTTSYLGGKIYHGIPYVSAGTALPQWYEYYGQSTGILDFPGDGQQLRWTLGHSCASCVRFSWLSVCTSLRGVFSQRFMVPKNGFFPVAPLKIPEDIETYADYPTDRIIQENGVDVLLEAYANALPADALNTQPANHVIMIVKKPRVVRYEDGTIDPNRSFFTVQDQRSGNKSYESGFLEYLEDGVVERYSGRVDCELSFASLLKESYIPLTNAEFLGQKAYEKAAVTFEGSTETLEDILAGHIVSNYPICVVRIKLFDDDTREELNFKKLIKAGEITSGLGSRYPMALQKDLVALWKDKEHYNLSVEVVLTTNETFRVIDTVI